MRAAGCVNSNWYRLNGLPVGLSLLRIMQLFESFHKLKFIHVAGVLSKVVALVQSKIGLDRTVGLVGAITGPVLIIRTVQCVELIGHYILVKNHFD